MKHAHHPVIICQLFEVLDDTRMSYSIYLADIYNIDKTGFIIGLP
jgi:hypothetical protein